VPDARTVDGQEQVLVDLEMDGPGVGRAGDELDGLRARGIADVDDRDPVAERVADVGVPAVDHDLDAVAPAALVRVAHELDVTGRDGVHPAALSGPSAPRGARSGGWGLRRSPGPRVGPNDASVKGPPAP
jgi:hypothetical protein